MQLSSEEPIQHEDSDRVWNEMTKYKKKCEIMKASLWVKFPTPGFMSRLLEYLLRLEFEEKASSLESKCVYQQSLLSEYDSSIQRKAIGK